MNARPGIFSLMLSLYLPSEKVVQPTCPPIEVTAVLPILTLLSLFTMALYPMAVAFFRLGLLTSARYPIAVLLEPLVLVKSACLPEAVLPEPLVAKYKEESPTAVLSLPVVLENNA